MRKRAGRVGRAEASGETIGKKKDRALPSAMNIDTRTHVLAHTFPYEVYACVCVCVSECAYMCVCERGYKVYA